jgi:hypothetical protein
VDFQICDRVKILCHLPDVMVFLLAPVRTPVLTRIENETRQSSAASDGCPALTHLACTCQTDVCRHVPAACPSTSPRAPILHLLPFGSHLPIPYCILTATHPGQYTFIASAGPPSSLRRSASTRPRRCYYSTRKYPFKYSSAVIGTVGAKLKVSNVV